MTDHSRPRPRSAGLFRAFWRWHFYASLIVIPALLMFAITGLIYLFRFQIEPVINADLMRVQPTEYKALPYEIQRQAVEKARPGDTIVSMTEPGAPDHSTRFTVSTPSEEKRDVFVNPYDGKVLGDLNPDTTLSGAAIRLHGDLMVGKSGEIFLELAACWALVMALTGYYLFAKGRKGRARQRAKGTRSARLRSNHARVGFAVGFGLLFLIVSGLPWTPIWGKQVQKLATNSGTSLWSQDHGALSNPTSTLDESLPHSHTIPWAQEEAPVPGSTRPTNADGEVSIANVDTAVAVGAKNGLTSPMTVALPKDDKGVFSAIGYAFNDPGKERTVHVDQFGGHVVSTYGYQDYPALAKVVSQGIALHEGRRFGGLNMALTTAFCVAVIASCITGPWMWWRRRPRGDRSMNAPKGRMPLRTTPALALGVIAMAIFLPAFGASLAIVLLLDRVLLSRWAPIQRFFAASATYHDRP